MSKLQVKFENINLYELYRYKSTMFHMSSLLIIYKCFSFKMYCYVFVKIFSFWGDNSLDLPTYGMRFYSDFVTYTSRVANLKLS